MRYLFFLVAVFVLTTATPAYAYLGPGMGIGTIGAVLGVVGSVFLAIFAVLFYPIKRMIKKYKARNKNSEPENSQE